MNSSNSTARRLSTGQKNQFEVVLALSQGADYILMDEPFAGNDIFNREDFYKVLLGILTEGETVILSTHIMQEAEAVCDRVLLLDHGRLVADSPTKDLRFFLHGQVLVKVEFNAEVAQSELAALEGVEAVRALPGCRYELSSRAEVDLRPLLFRLAVEKGLEVLTLQQEERSLESVFHQLTNLREEA